MRIIIGDSILGDRHLRIEFGNYWVTLTNGNPDKDCLPLYGVLFGENAERLFIKSMKELISELEDTPEYCQHESDGYEYVKIKKIFVKESAISTQGPEDYYEHKCIKCGEFYK